MEPKSKNDQFLTRMTVLNGSFVRFVLKNLEEYPGADLTPTINSYLKHVDELDKKFSNQEPRAVIPQVPEPTITNNTSISQISRKRPLPPSSELRTFDSNSRSPFSSSKQPKLTDPKPVDSDKDTSAKSTDSPFPSFKQKKLTEPTVVEPKPSEPIKSSTMISSGTAPPFGSFLSQSKATESKISDPKPPTFPEQNNLSTSSNGPKSFGSFFGQQKPVDTSISSIGEQSKNDTSASSTGFPLFGGSLSQLKSTETVTEKKVDTSAPTTGFSLFGSTFAPPKSTSIAEPAKTGTSAPTTGFQLFGSTFVPPPKTEVPKAEAPKTDAPASSEQDENEEPPKVEVVEQKEEGALFCMKTAIFTYKDNKWEKMGIGYVNVLPGDSNKRLVVRGANTLGTIWINTHVAEHFKACLKSEKAMTVRFPEAAKDDKVTIVQYLLKGGNPEDFSKLSEHLNANVLK